MKGYRTYVAVAITILAVLTGAVGVDTPSVDEQDQMVEGLTRVVAIIGALAAAYYRKQANTPD